MKKTRVIILFGGRSAEHEVSLLSARNIVNALDRERFEPVLVGIDKLGHWRRESERTLEAATGDPRLLALNASAPAVTFEQGLSLPERLDVAMGTDDVVFPALHGTYGEDGTVQGMLELAGVAYVGAGVLGSAIGMDKDVAKRLLREAGLPVVDFQIITAAALRDDPRAALARAVELGYPLFVKPANAGSSVGVSRVREPAALEAAVREALRFDRKALLERAVDAREIECAVLGNDDPRASVPSEIVVSHKDGFYSYDAKYVDPSGAIWSCPAQLPPNIVAHVQDLSIATFRALELAGMARVDFFLDRKTHALYVNEVNTIPGFTAGSMYPKMWEASGLPLRELVTKLIELAIERRDARRALSTNVSPA
ncbi:MAG TPA: D-alanine--D-alanine ligase family protein [Polyangia bacterium]|nr:D-alanine--D-alanine ligase family protein [Polyangia bacterium]